MIEVSDQLREKERAAAAELLALSNWGRWGNDDQRGALNFVTDEVTKKALSTVRTGRVIQLGQEIRGGRMGGYHAKTRGYTGPLQEGRPAPLLLLSQDGGDYAAGLRPGSHLKVAEDTIVLPIHGTATHVDGLSHTWAEDEMYNGFGGSLVRSWGAVRLGVENVGGVLTRGVLLDVAAYRGVEMLAADDYITEEDLAGCCEKQSVEIRSGDALLIHTGWPKSWSQGQRVYSGLQPGVGASGALFLANREICLLGSDTLEVQPFDGYNPEDDTRLEDPRRELGGDALHEAYLRNLGIHLLEILDLAELAEARVYEFLFVLAALRIKGGTGSPVNPLAVI
jgi:kynurenine formamidase